MKRGVWKIIIGLIDVVSNDSVSHRITSYHIISHHITCHDVMCLCVCVYSTWGNSVTREETVCIISRTMWGNSLHHIPVLYDTRVLYNKVLYNKVLYNKCTAKYYTTKYCTTSVQQTSDLVDRYAQSHHRIDRRYHLPVLHDTVVDIPQCSCAKQNRCTRWLGRPILTVAYGVALVSRIYNIIGLFCKRCL